MGNIGNDRMGESRRFGFGVIYEKRYGFES